MAKAMRITVKRTVTLDPMWFDEGWHEEMLAEGWSPDGALREQLRAGWSEDWTSIVQALTENGTDARADVFAQEMVAKVEVVEVEHV